MHHINQFIHAPYIKEITYMQLHPLYEAKDWGQLFKLLQSHENKKPSQELVKFINESLNPACEKPSIIRQIGKLIAANPKAFSDQTAHLAISYCLSLKDLTLDLAKAFISLLKATTALLQEFKIDPPEPFIKFVFRCSFVGIPQFTRMILEPTNTDLSSDSDSSVQDMVQKAFGKIRSSSIALLKVLIKEFPPYFQANWSILLRTKNYQEQTLLSLLVHEPRKNLKISVITALLSLLDVLNVGKWIQGHDFTKQQQGFQPKAYQLFQAVRSIHETNLYLLQNWKDQDFQLNAYIIKLEHSLITSCYILQKLPEEEAALPLYRLYLQMLPINEPQALNMKISIISIVNLLLSEGSKLLNVTDILQNAFAAIEENLDSNDNIVYLYVAECFATLQRAQQYFHKEFLEGVPNVWERMFLIKQNCKEVRQMQLFYRIFEEMSAISSPELVMILPRIILETLGASVEIVPCALNIIGNLNDHFWAAQKVETIQEVNQMLAQLHKNMFSDTVYNTSSLKISFYKGVGAYCNSAVLLQYPFVQKAVSGMFDKLSGHNIHVLEKSSWAAANLVSLTKLDASFFALFIGFANNQKEKISTNGLRGLGYFLMRSDEDFPRQELVECYRKALMNKNPKISWNGSTSLHNAIKNPKYLYLLSQNQEVILQILEKNENLKAQMHCMELVPYIQDSKWACQALKAMIKLLQHFVDHNNFIEIKYQNRMRDSIFETMESFFKWVRMEELMVALDEILHNELILERVVAEIYHQLLNKKPAESQIIICKAGLSKAEILELSNKQDDEKIFKAQSDQNYLISRYLKVVKTTEEFEKTFRQLSFVAKTLHEIIEESSNEHVVSFNALNALEELGNDSELITLFE